ncbi:hypothetical protein WK11_19360 [Burkholderia ubonensis]|nr:hypothetical protein WJ74_15180 [Burkholderia ubonensis]KVR02174.1 hypothetical protein WK11_19360 [Burkholderia ubonensis]KVR30055.1 hypothetical protein WK14_05065 [Burkholderia ubonensis]KVU88744.1 hypothetical protein WK75_20765 [Burkholderia ubonensis]KWB95373.1 hypothetical protein WL44_05115 [Burkholderia ubonensis]
MYGRFASTLATDAGVRWPFNALSGIRVQNSAASRISRPELAITARYAHGASTQTAKPTGKPPAAMLDVRTMRMRASACIATHLSSSPCRFDQRHGATAHQAGQRERQQGRRQRVNRRQQKIRDGAPDHQNAQAALKPDALRRARDRHRPEQRSDA